MSFREPRVFQGLGFLWNLGIRLVNALPRNTGSLVLLEYWRFLVVSENLPTHVHDLAEGRVFANSLDDGIHRVRRLLLEALLQTLQRVVHFDLHSLYLHPPNPLNLAALP